MELSAGSLKILAKYNYYLFPNYRDKRSKANLIQMNRALIELSAEQTVSMIITSLATHAKMSVDGEPK